MISPADLEKLAELLADRVAERLARQPRIVDRYQLAQRLAVSVPTIDRLRKSGQITGIAIGGRRMFDVEDVIQQLKNGPQ